MKIKLISKPSHDIPPRVQVMLNRGIPPKGIPDYIQGTTEHINPPEALGEELLRAGARMLISHIKSNHKAYIIVDSDCDGMTSAAHMINYLYEVFPAWTQTNLNWGLHEGKQHGLPDFIDRLETSDYDLVICPDSATNDIECIERLHNNNIDVLILDHHLSDVPISPYAVTINSQYNYPNPQLSGVGVVHKFCQYLDTLLGTTYSDKFLDLTAVGLMGDMMSMTAIETKEMIFQGLKDEAIVNPLIHGLATKNEFALSKSDYLPSSRNGLKITPIGAAFFVVPLLNAICRSGEMEEKELVFNSMLTMKAFDIIPSNKRGHKLGETERVLDQALRCTTNVKNRQTRNEEAGMELLTSRAEDMLDNKVLVFALEPDEISSTISGLVANKLASKYQRPVYVLFKNAEGASGSGRGYTATGIENMKAVSESSTACNWCRGHENAHGCSLNDVDKFVNDMNEALKDISTEIVYRVDYMWDASDIDNNAILELAQLNDYIGTDFARPMVYIHDCTIKDYMIMKDAHLKINLAGGASAIVWSVDETLKNRLQAGEQVTINFVAKCCQNEWNGNVTPQLIVEDWEELVIENPTPAQLWGF